MVLVINSFHSLFCVFMSCICDLIIQEYNSQQVIHTQDLDTEKELAAFVDEMTKLQYNTIFSDNAAVRQSFSAKEMRK